MQPPALEILDVAVNYNRRTVFKHVNLTLEVGESVAIIGQSGVGKTTLLNAVLGLLTPSSGSLHVGGQPMSSVSLRKRAPLRRKHIGTIFQNGELLPQLTALENVALPLLMRKVSARESFARANEFLDALLVTSRDISANRISGGERQRVALARAMVTEPALLLGDEPTGNLDVETRDEVADLLFGSLTQGRSALLMVTHDPVMAARADRIAHLGPEGLTWRSK